MKPISSCFGLACPDSARLSKTGPSMSGRQTVTGQTMPMARALFWPTRDLSVSHAVGAVVPPERSYRRSGRTAGAVVPPERSYRRLSAVDLTETISRNNQFWQARSRLTTLRIARSESDSSDASAPLVADNAPSAAWLFRLPDLACPLRK